MEHSKTVFIPHLFCETNKTLGPDVEPNVCYFKGISGKIKMKIDNCYEPGVTRKKKPARNDNN